MHQTIELCKRIKATNPLDTKNLVSTALKLVLEAEQRQQTKFIFLFRTFTQKDTNIALDYLDKIFKKSNTNKIIEYYANKDVKEIVINHYKNLPEFLNNSKYSDDVISIK